MSFILLCILPELEETIEFLLAKMHHIIISQWFAPHFLTDYINLVLDKIVRIKMIWSIKSDSLWQGMNIVQD